jgi:hypothetical protein
MAVTFDDGQWWLIYVVHVWRGVTVQDFSSKDGYNCSSSTLVGTFLRNIERTIALNKDVYFYTWNFITGVLKQIYIL